MNYKRLELYVGWTCNQKCTYCMEYPTMEELWYQKVTKFDILKKLLKYKKLEYNHVTFLGGEPFIQGVFFDALNIAKKLEYKILVTTNATTLHIDSQAKKFLPFIDDLILSVEAIEKEKQQLISRTKNFVEWEGVFANIKKYWKGNMLKANIVITKDNLSDLFQIVEFLDENNVKEIAITYPDIAYDYYGKEFILEKIAPKYSDCLDEVYKIIDFTKKKNINLKIVDFPFCVFKKEYLDDIIKLTDDYDYAKRLKLFYNEEENIHITSEKKEERINIFKRLKNIFTKENPEMLENLPRKRNHVDKCNKCFYKNTCWGPSIHYNKLYSLREIKPIKIGSTLK